jgi:gamma-glutamyltranspeptidase/glutathione hydrolase
MMTGRFLAIGLVVTLSIAGALARASSEPVRSRWGMVVSQKFLASQAGAEILREGGNAVDATVATAFALAVTLPRAGNIGGGGFLVYRPASGEPVTYDFREAAPSRTRPDMYLRDGEYDSSLHHASGLAVGVPGTVAGLHIAWTDHGKLPWKSLVEPAIRLARDGIVVTDDLARSLESLLSRPHFDSHTGSVAKLTRDGVPYRAGDVFKQPDLARTLERIAKEGRADFYEGETAQLIVAEMQRIGGLITLEDLKAYEAKKRKPIRGTYRGYEIISMPPPSSGGTALVQILNILEGYDLETTGFHSADTVHIMVEAMRRAFADRARYLGDPDFNPGMPIERLTSKDYAAELRKTIDLERASVSSPQLFEWPAESQETTHFSVVDEEQNAVSLTYTIEMPMTVVTGAGFLLNSELGDFNAGPGLTTTEGLIGTDPNLAAPGKRPLSSMTPTIVTKEGDLFMVTGTPGGRTIINTVLQTIIHAIDFGMNAQQAIDAGRIHHQWLPDRIRHERYALSPDTLRLLEKRGHTMEPTSAMGAAQVIIYRKEKDIFEAGSDRRRLDAGVATQESVLPLSRKQGTWE